MGLRMKSCWSSFRFCWARGSASLRREPRHAHSNSSARKLWPRASSSALTSRTDLCAPVPWAERRKPTSESMGKGRTKMRKLITAINTTLDGCVDHTKQFVDEEKLEYFTRLTREVDLQVFGRKTYQLMVPYWPEVLKNQSDTKADREFARAFDSTNKLVLSRSLSSTEDRNTRIARTNLRDEMLKLKQEQGKNILVGGVDIPSQLMELGLIDEYRFVVGPVVAGAGRRLFEGVNLPEKLQLKLVDSKFFKSGCVALHYSKSRLGVST